MQRVNNYRLIILGLLEVKAFNLISQALTET